jgi:DNA repair protein RadA/Sms
MKESTVFICKNCEKQYLKWSGYCSSCNEFDSIIEKIKTNQKEIKKSNLLINNPPVNISSIKIENEKIRLKTNILEFDRVLGGGIVDNSVILISGMPGIGKSTLLMKVCEAISKKFTVLYVTSEESISQIKLRANRLNIKDNENFYLVQETDFESICSCIEIIKPNLVILDSLQNMTFETSFLTNHIGKIKEAMHGLINHSRNNGYSLITTGHVTKDGTIAGPKSLEHLVDVVLYFEGEENSNNRILQTTKNRFGATDEIGFFIMTDKGIEENTNPQKCLIEHSKPTIGASLTWFTEGTRPFIIEIQALLNQTKNTNPQRVINGIDHKQLILVCAVLEKYLRMPLYEFDIFCKVSGNLKVKNSNTDLALAAAIMSSYLNKPLKNMILFSGEIGLSGNINSKLSIPKNLSFEQYGIEIIVSAESNIENNKNNIKEYTLKSIYHLYDLLK